jgi:hypothetical protein
MARFAFATLLGLKRLRVRRRSLIGLGRLLGLCRHLLSPGLPFLWPSRTLSTDRCEQSGVWRSSCGSRKL